MHPFSLTHAHTLEFQLAKEFLHLFEQQLSCEKTQEDAAMNTLNHETPRQAISALVDSLVQDFERATNYLMSDDARKQKVRLHSSDLAEMVANKHSAHKAFVQQVLKEWISYHPELEAVQGPNGGIRRRISI